MTQNVASLLLEIERLRHERELVSSALVVHAPDGTLLFSNAAASAILGLTPDQLAGRKAADPHWRFLRPDGSTLPVDEYPVSIVAASRQALKGYLLGVVRSEGEKPVWVQCDAYPELDDSGALQRIIVSAVDVTALQESRERLNLALQAASLGDWSWEAHTDLCTLSRRAADILGLDGRTQITWAEIREHLHPEDRERAATAVVRALEQRSIYDIEYRVLLQDGQERWILAQGCGTYGAQEQPVGMIGVVRDVTESKWQQQAAAAEAELLEILNATSSLIGAELDLDRLLQGVTDAATKLTGAKFGAFFYNGRDDAGDAYVLYTLSGAPRSAFDRFGHPRATPLFGPTFRGEGVIRVEDVLKDPRYGQWSPHRGMPPGHLPVRSYMAVSVVSRRGDVIGGLFFGHRDPGVFTERSERLALGIAAQASTAIDNARLYAEAQRATRQRDALLASERAARAEAESASRLKDQFLATLSHELRTPLSAILGWLHILRRKGTSDPAVLAKGLDVIERSARSQHQLIEDLLDMSRITSGKLHLNLETLDVFRVVRDAVELIEPSAAAADLRVDVDAAADQLFVRGDRARLQQAVWNLLSNSVKFTPRGGRIGVSAHRAGAHVCIAVQDTGIGIRDDFLPHLFDRFRQADGSASRRHGGLGLGLALVHQLVHLHGGQVRAESPGEGLGSTFTIELPAVQAVHEQQAGPTEPQLGDKLTGRVLVVEDDPFTREFLVRVLADAGAQLGSASNTAEAKAALGEQAFDLLISDIGMPGEDGYELVRWLRRQPGPLRDMPALALTAFARQEDVEAAHGAGFDEHIAKPVEPPALLRRAAALLRGRSRAEAAAPS